MSAREWAAQQYGVLVEGEPCKEFATEDAARMEITYLRMHGVAVSLAVREVHTTVIETPWVEIEAVA